jgi:hypothetical protein
MATTLLVMLPTMMMLPEINDNRIGMLVIVAAGV